MAPTTKSTPAEAEAVPVRAPRLGEVVAVAVHPTVHNPGGEEVVPAVVTRVGVDEDEAPVVDVHAFTTPPRDFRAAGWYPTRSAFEAAEADAYEKYLPGHRRRGDRIEPGENHRTQAPWRTEDVREWQTGAWPLDAGE